jgi:hypothetical protein
MRWSFLMPGNDSLKNLQDEGLASIDVPKYNEICARAEGGIGAFFASKQDDDDHNYVERNVQDIVIKI